MNQRRLLLAAGVAGSLLGGVPCPAQAGGVRPVQAEAPVLSEVIRHLQAGGLVLVMRHARSPRETPTREQAQPDNRSLERQLDAEGRAGAAAMGEALRRLRIPISSVLTSPAYRAIETLRHAGYSSFTTADELGDGGQSMQPATEGQSAWLRARAAQPPAGGNVLLVTHQTNIARAFPESEAVAEGEVLVLRPDGRGGTTLVGRIPIEAWPRLR
jgi:phosphohistidine phosphatase SixA